MSRVLQGNGFRPERVPQGTWSEFGEIGVGAVGAVIAATALWVGANVVKSVIGSTGGYGGLSYPAPTFRPIQNMPNVFVGEPPME